MGPNPRHTLAGVLAVLVLAPAAAWAAEVMGPPAYPDDPFIGEYVGTFVAKGGSTFEAEAKVFPVKAGYRVALLVRPTQEKPRGERIELEGKVEAKTLSFAGGDWSGTVAKKRVTASGPQGTFDLKWHERKGPTLGAKPPEGAVVLLPFEPGKPPSLDAWDNPSWHPVTDGSMMKGKGNIKTKRPFGSVRLHIEFLCPYEPDKSGQGRGNSGVYLQGKYEIQVLDSFGLVPGKGDCGAIYGVAVPRVNACLPPLRWQTCDITFTAPKVNQGGEVTEQARMTVEHNGVLIHQDQAVPGVTRSGMRGPAGPVGPLMLQDHGHLVRYRNIWLVERTD